MGNPHTCAAQHPDDDCRGSDDGDEDQHLRRSSQLRVCAEVADRPDARQLDRAQRRAEIGDRVEADDVRRQEGARGNERRQPEGHEEADEGRSRPHGPSEAALADDEDEAGTERRSEPHERAGVQHAEQERRDGGQRHQLTQAIRPRGQRHERGQDGQRPRGAHLLDAAPERVPVQQRGLRADNGR